MRVYAVLLGIVVACAAAMAVEHGPLLQALQPVDELEAPTQMVLVPTDAQGPRQKRGLLLGAGAAGLLGAGIIGAGALGAGALGAGLIGAKAGLVGGALAASALHGRSYGGGYGYGGGYSYGGGYGYRRYPTYVIEEDWY